MLRVDIFALFSVIGGKCPGFHNYDANCRVLFFFLDSFFFRLRKFPCISGLQRVFKIFYYFLKFIYLSNLYTQCGARSHHPEIKSLMLYQLSLLGAPTHHIDFDDKCNLLKARTNRKTLSGKRGNSRDAICLSQTF